ncbi:hypothetical protein NEOLEDRAFT_1178832 [Neolentinus lepideus HHB14362 ss-1]|uniref:Uncharacterized protein n=1 Tax=Neolentinus lepideus HHB14362 ss-1 TaxID=1314782 RepID=A0A165SFQ8_9AGAM|nr:hypothetical protein NEOLEDRAFT_1178832 [Neolentinus lepideus HHB14362 ss-1]
MVGTKQYMPFRGSALLRFERSTLHEHRGTRTVVLRLVKFLTPLERADHMDDLAFSRTAMPRKEGLY